MRSNFDTALKNVLESEGGWSDIPYDPGGATMKGITLSVYQTWKRNPHITKEQLRVIPDEDVYNLYKELYWDKIHGDDLPSGIDYIVFDSSVNMGVGRAIKLIQEAAGVASDGVLGSQSLAAIKAADPKQLIEKFSQLKEEFYKSLKTFPVFGKGWLNRVAEVKERSELLV